MSVRASTWAWEQGRERQLGQGQLLTLLRIADHSDNDGICWPGEKHLAEYTAQGERTVRRHLDQLEADGLLRRERRQSNEGRGRAPDRILLALDQPAKLAAKKSADQPVTDDTSTGQSRHDQPATDDTAPYREPSREPSQEPSGRAREEAAPHLQSVLRQLDRVVFDRGLPTLKISAAEKACEDFADRDLEFEADKFAHYYVDGAGENRRLKDVVGAWRNWLRNAPTAEKARARRGGPRSTVEADLAELEAEAERQRAIEVAEGTARC